VTVIYTYPDDGRERPQAWQAPDGIWYRMDWSGTGFVYHRMDGPPPDGTLIRIWDPGPPPGWRTERYISPPAIRGVLKTIRS
jgi:hypothetical protein